ncbi:MAG: hypothetical protein IJ752_06265 [Alphaproteobacteria bacterium]|nr:hypothetical protein [Alphaproteobacteria bacterium]
MYKHFVTFSLIFLLTACGHTGREHPQMIDFVKNGDFESAQKITEKDDFYKDRPSLLVRHFELGTLHYLKGEYYQALQNFDKAHELSKRFYTKSVSKFIASQVVGDGIVPYAGEKYELSLLRFYQSLTHYRLYEQGFYEAYTVTEKGKEKTIEQKQLSESEKRLHFNGARAAIVDWNSLLTTYSNEAKSKNDFRQDMLAKTYGAEIHDIYGSNGDKQIARQLYKDVQRLLDSVYADYDAYAASRKEQLSKYAQRKGRDLVAAPKTKENVKFVLKSGLITPTIAEIVDFVIPWEAFLASGSKNDLADCLGTILPGQRISFEIPSVEKPKDIKNYRLVVLNNTGKAVMEKEMVLTAPVSETAYREYQKRRPALIAQKGTRLTSKYVSAVVSSCAVYKRDDALSWLAAYGTFAGLSKIIQASEYADIRYWGLLPHAVFQQSAALKPGSYTGEIRSDGKTVKTFTFTAAKSRPVLVDLNLPNE